MNEYSLLEGDDFTDHRGTLKFFNSLNMSSIVRMYEISPIDIETIRAWQAHKKENKWFYCTNGKFIINLILIDNFENPSKKIAPEKIVLDTNKPMLLKVSGGYASGIKAIENKSKLMVFSNFTTEQSKKDDFRFPSDFWIGNWD